MLKLIGRRLLLGVASLVGTSFLIFFVTDKIPGDFATAILSRDYSQSTAEVIREKLGLYQPLLTRYVLWLGEMFQGNFGISWTGYALGPILEVRMERTMWLTIYAASVAFPVAFGLGIFSALNRYNNKDRAVVVTNTMMMSIPEFLTGYIVMTILAVQFDVFPSLALVDDDAPVFEKLHAWTLPVITLLFVTIPPVMRIVRASLINTLNSEYVEMAILKGISPIRILIFHALPNNIGAVANATALGLANLIAGIVIVEIIFVYPGIGSYFVGSINMRDVPSIQACGVILASVYVSLIMIADVIAIASNPKLISKQKMHLLHPGQVIRGFKYAPIVIVAGLIIYLTTWVPKSVPETDSWQQVDVSPPSKYSSREYATVEELLDAKFLPPGAVHNDNFMALGDVLPAQHDFSGRLRIEETELIGRRAGGEPRYGFGSIPEINLEFVGDGNQLIPVKTGFLETEDSDWEILVGPGRVWSEGDDGNYSRASFPFSLVGRIGGDSHYGIAMFVYDGDSVSNLRYQITQESALRSRVKFTSWGQAKTKFSDTISKDADKVIDEYHHYASTNIPRKPWSKLFRWVDEAVLNYFDGKYSQGNITSSGMIIDGVIYQKPCQTRFGDFPYCENIRHTVFSVSKTLGAAVTLSRLAEKYGDQVLDAKIVDYVDIPASHDGWEEVTFSHAINMGTGIGDIFPEEVDFYVDGDNSPAASRVFVEENALDKIRQIGKYNKYKWGPGKILRYRTTDTFLLSFAMDRFLKSREGGNAMLWDMMVSEVYQPIGIQYLPVMHTADRKKENRIPQLGYQMFPTIDDIAKIVQLLRNGGAHEGIQLLSKNVVDAMLDVGPDTGLRSFYFYPEGGEARYNMAMWLIPYAAIEGCSTMITSMTGVGGNYVLPMKNGITPFRFADRYEDHPGTYDSYEMRTISDLMKSLCN